MKTLIFLFLIFSLNSFTQENKPSQKDIAKRGIGYFFIDFPNSVMNNFLKFYGLDPYSNYVRMHKRNPNKSPWSVFYGIQHRRVPTRDHSFTFVNQDYDFADVAEIEFGVCSSMTFGLRRFNMLAHFDDFNKAGQKVPDQTEDFEAWLKFYFDKIDDVFRLRPTVFPYFQNLNQLASIPQFKYYMKLHVLNLWVMKNVSIRGLIQLVSVKEEPNRFKNKLLHKQLTDRLNRAYNPIVFLSQPRSKIYGPVKGDSDETEDHWIHVVQVYKVDPMKADGSYNFYIWDINEELIEYTQKKIEVKANGEVRFPDFDSPEGYFNLSAAKLFPEDDKEIGIILRNKAWWCHHNPKFKDYCYQEVTP